MDWYTSHQFAQRKCCLNSSSIFVVCNNRLHHSRQWNRPWVQGGPVIRELSFLSCAKIPAFHLRRPATLHHSCVGECLWDTVASGSSLLSATLSSLPKPGPVHTVGTGAGVLDPSFTMKVERNRVWGWLYLSMFNYCVFVFYLLFLWLFCSEAYIQIKK